MTWLANSCFTELRRKFIIAFNSFNWHSSNCLCYSEHNAICWMEEFYLVQKLWLCEVCEFEMNLLSSGWRWCWGRERGEEGDHWSGLLVLWKYYLIYLSEICIQLFYTLFFRTVLKIVLLFGFILFSLHFFGKHLEKLKSVFSCPGFVRILS